MEHVTLLEENQIFGDGTTKPLKIFKKYGTKAAVTDFSILLGAYVNDDEFVGNRPSLEDRTAWWWTRTTDQAGDAFAVAYDGSRR